MIDVNWDDNAKAAVNTYNDWALENYLGIHAFFEHLTNNGHTQPKTVADAVAFCKKWNAKEFDYLFWHENIGFLYRNNREATLEYKFVCTRQQFEAYAKEQEAKQECEKWTHTYNQGEMKCKIIQTKTDFNGCVVVLNDFEEYQLIEPEELKPIKPTISKAEAWNILMARQTNSSEVNTIKQQYDII